MNIPYIMTANTYFWRPAPTADGRRANEQKRRAEVEAFLAEHRQALEEAGIVVDFYYYESCNHVYKHCKITRHGKRSNITALRKALHLDE